MKTSSFQKLAIKLRDVTILTTRKHIYVNNKHKCSLISITSVDIALRNQKKIVFNMYISSDMVVWTQQKDKNKDRGKKVHTHHNTFHSLIIIHPILSDPLSPPTTTSSPMSDSSYSPLTVPSHYIPPSCTLSMLPYPREEAKGGVSHEEAEEGH